MGGASGCLAGTIHPRDRDRRTDGRTYRSAIAYIFFAMFSRRQNQARNLSHAVIYLFIYYPRRARSALGVDTVLALDVCLYVCMYVC